MITFRDGDELDGEPEEDSEKLIGWGCIHDQENVVGYTVRPYKRKRLGQGGVKSSGDRRYGIQHSVKYTETTPLHVLSPYEILINTVVVLQRFLLNLVGTVTLLQYDKDSPQLVIQHNLRVFRKTKQRHGIMLQWMQVLWRRLYLIPCSHYDKCDHQHRSDLKPHQEKGTHKHYMSSQTLVLSSEESSETKHTNTEIPRTVTESISVRTMYTYLSDYINITLFTYYHNGMNSIPIPRGPNLWLQQDITYNIVRWRPFRSSQQPRWSCMRY